MESDERVVALLRQLVAIDSQNPPGREKEIADFVKRYLLGFGVKSRLVEFKPGRTNVIARIKGRSAKELLISPHLDTVPAGKSWKRPPLRAEISGGKLYGLGTTDCKCNLAVSMEVMRRLAESRAELAYTLVFAATADEETGSALGIIPLLEKKVLKPDAAVVLDSDDFSIVVAQKGLLHVKVRIKGRKAHAAYPERGENAIAAAVKVLSALMREKSLPSRNPYLKPATMNIGTISGGDKVNVVADWCDIELDFRYLPGFSARDILDKLKRTVRRHARKFSLEIEGVQKPYLIDERHPLVSSLVDAMRHNRVRPLVSGSEGATVITFFQSQGIPAVATGFGSEGCAHIADEFVVAENVRKGVRVLEEFLRKYRFE